MKTIFALIGLILLTCAAPASVKPAPYPSAIVGLTVTPMAGGARVTLAWDANSEIDLAGYRVYWGNASRTYTNSPVPTVAVSAAPTYTTPVLMPGTWFFAVKAYNASGQESGYSNEVSTTIVATPPVPPTGLRIVNVTVAQGWLGTTIRAVTSEPATSTISINGGAPRSVSGKPSTQHTAMQWFWRPRAFAYTWTMRNVSGQVVGEYVYPSR